MEQVLSGQVAGPIVFDLRYDAGNAPGVPGLSLAVTTTIPQAHRDLLDSDVAVLATVGSDGRPQLSAVWFLAEGDTLRVSLNTSRQKVKNLRANPVVNLFLLDRGNPVRYLEVRGDAEIEDDADYEFASKVGTKYSADLRSFDGDNPHRIVVTVKPTRINAVDMSAH